MKIKPFGLYLLFVIIIVIASSALCMPNKISELKVKGNYKFDSFITSIAVDNNSCNLHAVATERSVIFYDNKGKISKEYLLSAFKKKDEKAFATLSDNAQYYAIERSMGLYETVWGMFEYRDRKGKLLFQRSRDVYGEEFFKISNDGQRIIGS